MSSTFRNRSGRSDYRSAFNNRKRSSTFSSFANPASRNEDEQFGAPVWTTVRANELAEDAIMGFQPLPPGSRPRIGWLFNMVPATVEEPGTNRPVQAVDLFFITDDAIGDFRVSIISRPYLYVAVAPHYLREVEIALRRKFPDVIAEVSIVRLEDTTQPNHLAQDNGAPFLKIETRTLGELYQVRQALNPIILRNKEKKTRLSALETVTGQDASTAAPVDPMDAILDMREYDVAPVNRLAIDKKINVGYWYKVKPPGESTDNDDIDMAAEQQSYEEDLLDELESSTKQRPDNDPDINVNHANDIFSAHLTRMPEIVERASPVVLAYDIECTKKPLKFPDADAGDQVMMISWMLDGKGYLVINREVVTEDIEDFDYSPHAEFKGSFQVFNEVDERAVLQRFFGEIRLAAPRVFVTYNGDFFDWPFVEKRAAILGLDMGKEIAMRGSGEDSATVETKGRTAIHMDAFHWVNRDSYLPQGSRGLKAVTRALLGFEPEEIPPEEMMDAARDRPKEMAMYSVSDAVCTYFLYMKYVHPFIFSLCNIIPLSPDDVLRKGSGTLCEMLLMCQAREKRIVAPNKYQGTAIGKLTDDGHVLETETYIGGHVEAIRTGVYRSDLPLEFTIDTDMLEDLEKTLDDTLHFAITVEGKTKMEDVTNYDEVRAQIVKELHVLRDKPIRSEKPLIYHLDVSAMYPNIILTNRLQPHAVVTPEQCAACDFNGMSECQRDMEWTWRGEYFPASRGEAEMIQRRAAQEEYDQEMKRLAAMPKESANDVEERDGGRYRNYKRRRQPENKAKRPDSSSPTTTAVMRFDNVEARKSTLFRSRLKEYCRVNYRKVHQTREVEKTATICQRENPFYVDTVRAFRDRRYEYKALLKKQKKAKAEAKESGDKLACERADNLVVLYDSLQLAHKCILNSFYGYVMRKGARWYSMEMAGIVTNTGGLIIKRAREFIDKVGLSLELDTDGIWCVLPVSFPENFTFNTKSGKKCSMSYICSIFNADVAANFSNHQYQDLVDPATFEYTQRSECSIFFEVDGPYKAMVLPASLEEGKSIKKRYAVFNDDGSIAELKGFEIKRRGELKLVKQFQGEIFDCFLKGESLSECYEAVGKSCNKWLDIILTKGEGMTDTEILELLVEQNNMSKALDEYLLAKQKSCAITCATRMKEFLGDDIVRDKGLAAMYVVARKPDDDQVTARAIPVKIFELKDENTRRRLLKKWTKNWDDDDLDLRELLDWNYYKGRLANAVLKIVSIPAALQGIDNPVPRIEYPPWLMKKVREMKDQRKQRTVTSFFSALPKGSNVKLTSFKSLRDASTNTEKMTLKDIEDMPIRSWTTAEVAHRRAKAVVTRRKEQDKLEVKLAKKGQIVFKSSSRDPETRAEQTRKAMLALVRAPHPHMRRDYPGWVRYAKKIWRAQRAVRVHRYALKRQRLGIESFAMEEGGRDEESDSDNGNDSFKEGEVEPFGGKSFAARFGLTKNRKKRRRLSDSTVAPEYAPENFVTDLRFPAGVSSFFKKKAVPLIGPGVVWQNVAISPVTESPGQFNLWVLPVKKIDGHFESGDLHSLPLRVKRVLYYNSKVNIAPVIPGVSCELVKGLLLPRSQASQHLFKLELSEARFQNTDKDLTSVLTDVGAVDGVFGTQCPLEYEAIVTLGTLCTPSRSIARRSTMELLSNGVFMDDLTPKGHNTVPYLQGANGKEQGGSVLNQAFLYGSHASDGSTRAMYILVAPQAKLVHAVAVTPGGNLSVNVKRLWKSVVERQKKESNEESGNSADLTEADFTDLPSDCQFYASGATTREGAWSELQSILSRLRNSSSLAGKGGRTGLKTILLAQWPGLDTSTATEALFGARAGTSSIQRKLSAVEECVPMTKSFPVVRLANNAGDGNYMPVGWEAQAITVALGRFVGVSNWLSSQLTLSRFASIPIGNVLSTHVHSQAIDVLVGRELMNRDHVLWASESAHPDLGGLEEDDNNLQNEVQSVPEVSVPGSYRTVCIDTELSNLAIATILSSAHVNQLEGTDMAFDAACNSGATSKTGRKGKRDEREGTVGGRVAAPLDEMASSAPAFRVLKELVATWDKAANNEHTPEIAGIARGLLDHVHRWTRSEASVLYDPALARFLGWLIRKVFRQLVGELRNLGAHVVYASMSRLILATPKTVTIDGLRYAGFLEKTVKEKSLFKHIEFEPLLGVYSSLLFVDRFNYGALPAPEERMIMSGQVEELQSSRTAGMRRMYASRDIPYVRMMWDMARYLPIPVAVLWTQVVEEFIRRPMIQRLREEERIEEDGVIEEDADGHDVQVLDGDRTRDVDKIRKRQLRPRGDGYATEVKSVVRSLTAQLLEKVHEIREKAPTLVFPEVPSVLKVLNGGNRNCALEFVRCLCHVLALDGACVEEVGTMRRSLLQLLSVREFAKEGRFVEPSLPVPLHDVICTYCNAVVDLDIARDSRLWTEDDDEKADDDGKDQSRRAWACEYCGHGYDLRQIEMDLVRMAQKLFTSYQVQDVVCGKCRMVKRENMVSHCGCSGAPFQLSLKKETMHNKLFALKSVAEFHKFEFLGETVSWILSSTSNPTASLARANV